MTEVRLKPITQDRHFDDALDLAERAADYVVLEIGHAPDADFVTGFFTELPPDVPSSGLMTFAVMLETAMVGMTCIAEGYEFSDDWWLGLMLLDPAFRGRGLGRQATDLVKARAAAQHIAMVKLSVLDANPRGMKFWRREGFEFHRHAPAHPGSDGHARTVLKFVLQPRPDRPF